MKHSTYTSNRVYRTMHLLFMFFCPVAFAENNQTQHLVGISVVDGQEQGPCELSIIRDASGEIVSMSLSGIRQRSGMNLNEATEPAIAGGGMTIGERSNAEEIFSYTSFSSKLSLAHPGYTRVGLQINYGTFEHPWPGFQEVRYIVQKNDYQKVIARNEIYLLARIIPLGYDTFECENLKVVN